MNREPNDSTTDVHPGPGLYASPYRPLKPGDVRRIGEAAMEVLERSGMLVYSDAAMEALKRAGARVDASTRVARLPRAMVEDAIDSNPSSVTLHSRDGRCDAVLERDRVHYGTGGTALYVLDPDTGERRQALVEDVVLNARLVDRLENVHVFTINVFPHDVKDDDDIDVNRFFHAFDNTTKHVMGGIYTMHGLKNVVGMAQKIAGGAEPLRAAPFVSFITLIISPFKIDKLYGDMTCYLAEEGLPVVVPTEPICGTTSPITLAGNVLTHTAETLGGITLVQAVRKGAPGICGSVGSIPDLHTMNHLAGPIERAMINAAVAQMAQFFELPLYSTGGTSDAKEVDVQAAYESAMSSLLVAMSGANYIHDIAGLMESDLTVGYDKLVLDNEILGMCQRVLRGIEVTDDTLATDVIIESGPGKDFLINPHTMANMHGQFYMPELANRTKRDQMTDADTATARARTVVDQVRGTPPVSRLDAAVRRELVTAYPEILMPEVTKGGVA